MLQNVAPELIAQQTINLHTDNIHLKTYAKMGGTFGETGIKDGSMDLFVDKGNSGKKYEQSISQSIHHGKYRPAG